MSSRKIAGLVFIVTERGGALCHIRSATLMQALLLSPSSVVMAVGTLLPAQAQSTDCLWMFSSGVARTISRTLPEDRGLRTLGSATSMAMEKQTYLPQCPAGTEPTSGSSRAVMPRIFKTSALGQHLTISVSATSTVIERPTYSSPGVISGCFLPAAPGTSGASWAGIPVSSDLATSTVMVKPTCSLGDLGMSPSSTYSRPAASGIFKTSAEAARQLVSATSIVMEN